MCWSQRVSLFFWLYDVACLVYLYRRRRQDDAKYIAMLFGVMLQEWWQFVVWRVRDDHCTPALAIASVGAVLSSQSITLGVLAAGEMDVTKGDETRRRRQGASLALWALQLVVTAACVVRAGRWCASIGTWGHQIWICAQSLYEVGGYPLYLGMLAVYVAALIQAFKALSLPAREKSALKTLGCVNAAFIYALYTTTLEACSIWCWSAAALAAYAVVRQSPTPLLPAS